MKNLIISDLHLKEQDKDFFKIKREELIKDQISKIIMGKSIKRVFFNGDTFNESSVKNHWYAVSFFIDNILKPLISNNIEVHILLGNHERFWKSHVFSFLEDELSNNLIFIHNKITHIEMDDFNAVFIPFMYPWDRDVRTVIKLQEIIETEVKLLTNKIKQSSNKPVIVFNHNMMSDLPFDIGREMNLKFWEYPEIDFVFWWHIHKHEVFSTNNKEKWVYVWSFMKSFVYEEETEWYITFDINSDNSINYKFFENTSYSYEKIEVDDAINFNDELIKENTVYDIKFLYSTQNPDHNFISDILVKIKNKNSFVKNQQIISKDSDVNLTRVISLLTNEKDILKTFLKDNEIPKDKYDNYYSKLEQCLGIISINENLDIDNSTKENKNNDEILNNVKKVNALNNIINKSMAL